LLPTGDAPTLRNDRVIDDNVMQRVQRDLDLEAVRLE